MIPAVYRLSGYPNHTGDA